MADSLTAATTLPEGVSLAISSGLATANGEPLTRRQGSLRPYEGLAPGVIAEA